MAPLLVFLLRLLLLLQGLCAAADGASLGEGRDGASFSPSSSSPTVKTIYGDVRGRRMEYPGSVMEEFKGIPFARPPVGELRWERPLPPASWSGVLEAGEYGAPCTQYSREVKDSAEDCLYLNVWVPAGVQARLKSPLPVMVWTYGGGYQTGRTQLYPSHVFAETANVIVVSHNYRVSVLGGLATSDAASPGNYMLWDARAALLWVRDNIRNFGGDTSRITIFGASAGGAMVSHMMASPLCEGLFHRALTLSGVASGAIGIQVNPLENARNVALLQDCPSEQSTRDMVECLRGKNASEVDQAGYPAMALLSGQIPGWGPVIDGQIVPIRPNDAFMNGAGRNVDYMVGKTEDEAAGYLYLNMRGLPGNYGNVAETKSQLYAAMTYVLQSYRPGDTDTLIAAITDKYPDMRSDHVTTRTRATCRAITDGVWTVPTHFEADAHSRSAKKTGKNTYVYNFKYRPSFVHYASWVTASHANDHYLVFGEPYRQKLRQRRLGNFTDTDRFVSESMGKYYGNFAHTGDPNKGPHKVPAPWPAYDASSKQYLEMGAKMTPTKVDADMQSRIDFWENDWTNITLPYHDRHPVVDAPEENMVGFHLLADMAADQILSMGASD